MRLVPGPQRIVADDATNPLDVIVRWAPGKSLWLGTMTAATIGLGPFYFSFSAFAIFLIGCAATLSLGHSVGMHRRLIHGSFECPRWLEYLCVYLGTLVGMAGPIGMIWQHDLRDWAQRQPACHDFFSHRGGFWRDAWRQLHCRPAMPHGPAFRLERRLREDVVYTWMERLWMWHQLPWAVLLFASGGLSWVIWGVCARVSVCVTGHWLVGHFAHRRGRQSWVVHDAAVQGYDLPIAALVSMGEAWHNNHHAFPGSARLGLLPGQIDPGWWVIRGFAAVGLAYGVRLPPDLPARPQVRAVASSLAGASGAAARNLSPPR